MTTTADRTTSTTSRGEADKMTSMHTVIEMPYTLSSGPAAGTFLAELANRRIVGSRAPGSTEVAVPAQDFSAVTGAALTEFVVVPGVGRVTGATTTAAGTFVLVRLAGASTDLLHRLAGDDPVAAGDTVRAVWA